MTQPTTRTYLVINPGVLFAPDTEIRIRSSAPIGTVVQDKVFGRDVLVLLTGDPLYGGLLRADLVVRYL
ncbi:hypothetical protein ACTU45_23900 [Streptomyces sp. 24-1644]|uniref:hypothetical protein n=1 Tax=Streptomyces sp. 24-1644 TaxID=3457315 RepID=UPI003FA7100F